jgi:catechol 2,3-dioxygenase-like lactoylglutathione lyase family enzyme
MHDHRYDHVHLRSPDPDATARFFEIMFGAEVKRSVYPPGTLYPGQERITMRLGGQTVLIAPPHLDEPNATAPSFPHYGLEHIGLTVHDVDATVAELRAKGAEIAIGPLTRNPGLRLAFIRGTGRHHDRARAALARSTRRTRRQPSSPACRDRARLQKRA